MNDIFMIDKEMMSEIISELKGLDVIGFESMGKLVSIVYTLELAMNPPPVEQKTVKKKILPGEDGEQSIVKLM